MLRRMTRAAAALRVSGSRASLEAADARLHLGTEVADDALHGPSGRIAQGADAVALDLARNLLEHVDLLDLGVAGHHACHDVAQPRRALAARSALAATLVLVELYASPSRLLC